MHNTSYQTRKSQHEEENILKENAAMTHPVGSLAKSSSGGVSSSSGGGGGYKIKNQSTNNILITLEEQQLENEILMRTYLPFHLISTCFRNMCTSYEIEKMLIMKINDLHHQILNKNIRLGSHFHHPNPSTSSSTATSISSVAGPPPSKEDLIQKYELLMRPTAVTDVKIQDLINYLDESNNEITKILLIEQRKLTKKLTKYFYKSNDKEKL